ncbi:MAG: LysR family transcriptional regulator, partial [Rhodomicrobium sp.]|nr:LysR family transcriptional regulator [Rhodomicrobium sp.]
MKDNQRYRLPTERHHSDALDLNLRSLDIFIQIAENGGMSSTARRMGLTQSAVSQMIANLELSLGVQLFDRHVRPIALTPSGIVLLEKSRGLLLAARDAIQSARQPAAAAFPRLNLCLVETIAGTIGPDLVKNIQEFADLWSVHAGLHSQHNRALLSREADIVLTPDPLEDEANLERYEILKEPFFIALPKDFPGEITSLAALAEERDFVRF